MRALRLTAALVALLLCPPLSPSAAASALDEQFARILELEDRRATGGGELLKYLGPDKPLMLRLRAALAVGRIGSPVVTPYQLVAALQDQEAELRRMAAFALGEMDDVKAAPLLAAALADKDDEVRALAVEALGKLRDPASAPSVMALLDDPDPRVAGMALLALWKVDAGTLLPRQVERAFEIYAKAEGDLRSHAVYFLMRAQMAHPEEDRIEEALLKAARDEDPLIRSYAARGLGAARSAQSTEALLVLAGDHDSRARVNAFNGLRTRRVEAEGRTRSRWKVYKAGLKEKDPGTALAALAALESCGAPEAREHLARALADERPRIREVAALALAGKQKKEAMPLITRLADDAAWPVRARAADALGSIGGTDILGDLSRLAGDPDPRVRSVAIENLGRLGSEHARAAIAAALSDDDPYVRAAALEAMAPSGGASPAADGVVAALSGGYRRALSDPQNDARLAALAALGRIGGGAARAGIESALDDPDYLVRRRAAELLRDLYREDRFSKVGEPTIFRVDADYVEAVGRAGREVTATFDTDAGQIVARLFPADAPLTVDNFLRLAREGRLDGLAFHRVVPNFVIQGGDPRGDGNGGPPWQIRCEINLRRYGEGVLGMALSGKDTGGSQYFITHSPQPHLDGGYTIFGQVVAGQEIVNRIMQGDAVRRVTIAETPASQGVFGVLTRAGPLL